VSGIFTFLIKGPEHFASLLQPIGAVGSISAASGLFIPNDKLFVSAFVGAFVALLCSGVIFIYAVSTI